MGFFHEPVLLAGPAHRREVPFVEERHGGDEADRLADGPGGGGPGPQALRGAGHLHRARTSSTRRRPPASRRPARSARFRATVASAMYAGTASGARSERAERFRSTVPASPRTAGPVRARSAPIAWTLSRVARTSGRNSGPGSSSLASRNSRSASASTVTR